MLLFFIVDMSKLIRDYLKQSSCTQGSSSLSRNQTNLSNIQQPKTTESAESSNVEQSSSTCGNINVPVQCQPGADYTFPLTQFGKKKRSCQASWFRNFPWLHYCKEKESVFCMFCIKHKGKLTAEHNLEEAYITKGFGNWNSPITIKLKHTEQRLRMNP